MPASKQSVREPSESRAIIKRVEPEKAVTQGEVKDLLDEYGGLYFMQKDIQKSL